MIKLLSLQIPSYWEIIKYTVVRVDRVNEENLQSHLNELLQALLSNKAQCWMRVDQNQNRELIALLITRIEVDKIGKKFLRLQSLYSFKKVDEDVWIKDIDFIRKFARQMQCSYISLRSESDRVWKIVERLGFKEFRRIFIYNLE